MAVLYVAQHQGTVNDIFDLNKNKSAAELSKAGLQFPRIVTAWDANVSKSVLSRLMLKNYVSLQNALYLKYSLLHY